MTRFIFFLGVIMVMETSQAQDELPFQRISLQETYATSKDIYRWQRIPTLFATSQISAIDSSRPLIACERVLNATQAASALLKQIFQEQERLAELLEILKGASPSQIEEQLHKVRKSVKKIEALKQKLIVIFPIEYQEKDRVRTLRWKLDPYDFADLTVFPRAPRIEWAQLEILAGDGGWFGSFHSLPSSERPMKKRLESFLAVFNENPPLQHQIRNEFDLFLRSIVEQFASHTLGSRGIVDWQGSSPVELIQELSPVEACIPHVFFTSSILFDYDIRPPEEYPNPEFIPSETTFRLGMGPVLLTYYELKNQ